MYTNVRQWTRVRNRILVLSEPKRHVANKEKISRQTVNKMLRFRAPPGYGGRNLKPPVLANRNAVEKKLISGHGKSLAVKQRWMEWRYSLERDPLVQQSTLPDVEGLIERFSLSPNNPQKKILTALAHDRGFSISAIAEHLGITRNTARRYLVSLKSGGTKLLLSRKQRKKKADNVDFKKGVFALLQ